jgi:hypothetical protein
MARVATQLLVRSLYPYELPQICLGSGCCKDTHLCSVARAPQGRAREWVPHNPGRCRNRGVAGCDGRRLVRKCDPACRAPVISVYNPGSFAVAPGRVVHPPPAWERVSGRPGLHLGDFCQRTYHLACLFIRLLCRDNSYIVRLCACYRSLKTNENPAQPGIFFSGNRLKSRIAVAKVAASAVRAGCHRCPKYRNRSMLSANKHRIN